MHFILAKHQMSHENFRRKFGYFLKFFDENLKIFDKNSEIWKFFEISDENLDIF